MFNPNAVTENPTGKEKPFSGNRNSELQLELASKVSKIVSISLKNLRNYWSKNGGRNFLLTKEKGPQSRKYLGATTTGLGRRGCSIHTTGRVIDSWNQSFAFLQNDGSASVSHESTFCRSWFSILNTFSRFFHDFSARWCRCRCNCCGWGAAGSGEFSPFAFSRERRSCEFLGGVDLGKSFRIILKAPKKTHLSFFELNSLWPWDRTRSRRPLKMWCGVLCRIFKWMRKR